MIKLNDDLGHLVDLKKIFMISGIGFDYDSNDARFFRINGIRLLYSYSEDLPDDENYGKNHERLDKENKIIINKDWNLLIKKLKIEVKE